MNGWMGASYRMEPVELRRTLVRLDVLSLETLLGFVFGNGKIAKHTAIIAKELARGISRKQSTSYLQSNILQSQNTHHR